jgi:phage head maturation protease
MKGRVKVTDEFLNHLPEQMAEEVASALKDSDVEPVLKRVPTVDVVRTGVDGAGSADLYASTRKLDRDREIVLPGPLNIGSAMFAGMSLEQYKLAPILLFAHQWSGEPIGSMDNTHSDGYGVRGIAKFSSIQRAQNIWTLVQEGHLKTSSIGFIPTKVVDKGNPLFTKLLEFVLLNWGEFNKREAVQVERFVVEGIMLENSIVPVPANPDALIQAVSGKSFDPDLLHMMGYEESDGVVVRKSVESDTEVKETTITTSTTITVSDAETVVAEPNAVEPSDEVAEIVAEVDTNQPVEGCEPQEKHVKCIARLIRGPEAKTVKRASAEDVAALAKKHLELRTGKI